MNNKAANSQKDELHIQTSEPLAQSSNDSKHPDATAPDKTTAKPIIPKCGFADKNKPGQMWDGTEEEWEEIGKEAEAQLEASRKRARDRQRERNDT